MPPSLFFAACCPSMLEPDPLLADLGFIQFIKFMSLFCLFGLHILSEIQRLPYGVSLRLSVVFLQSCGLKKVDEADSRGDVI